MMLPSYEDIWSKLGRPLWWDFNGVPRYSNFHPSLCDLYAGEAALYEVKCQGCGASFKVAETRSKFDTTDRDVPVTLKEEILAGTLHYGDPPAYGCCASGPTMNSEFVSLCEYWRRGKYPEETWIKEDLKGYNYAC